ncbi:MAG: alpha/beta hydrolase [Desulfatitalea sp.]|nr:alpha/beta hydrolase [Desulfatitalea sp.]
MVTQPSSIVHSFVDVNNVRIHYASVGQGALMLFVHGFPEFWAAWQDQLVEFGRDRQAVALDLRGFNLSSRPADPRQYHIKLLVEDLRELMEHLGHRRMVLVAHDWGGGVAWAFANRYPECIEKLVIINSPHPVIFARELLDNPAQRQASAYMNLFRSPDAEKILSADNYAYLADILFRWGGHWRFTPELRKRYIEAWSQPGALTGGLNYYRISPLHPPTSEAEEAVIRQIAQAPRQMFSVTVPTLVIWGELDEALLVGNLNGLEQFVDRLTVRRIPDATHWVVHEQSARIDSLIRSFVDDGAK